jgi:hypothetical protein
VQIEARRLPRGYFNNSTQYFSAITACMPPKTISASEMGMCTSSQR